MEDLGMRLLCMYLTFKMDNYTTQTANKVLFEFWFHEILPEQEIVYLKQNSQLQVEGYNDTLRLEGGWGGGGRKGGGLKMNSGSKDLTIYILEKDVFILPQAWA